MAAGAGAGAAAALESDEPPELLDPELAALPELPELSELPEALDADGSLVAVAELGAGVGGVTARWMRRR